MYKNETINYLTNQLLSHRNQIIFDSKTNFNHFKYQIEKNRFI